MKIVNIHQFFKKTVRNMGHMLLYFYILLHWTTRTELWDGTEKYRVYTVEWLSEDAEDSEGLSPNV
jgi:hypothetical protein